MTIHTRTSSSTPTRTPLRAILAVLLSVVTTTTTPALAQDEPVSRPFVQASISRIRAFTVDGQVTHDFKIPSVEAYGEIHDVVRLPDGRFVVHASTYASPSQIIICTATSSTTATCTEHTVRMPSFPFRFTVLGNSLFFPSPGSKESPGDGIVRFDLNTHTSTLLPFKLGIVVAGQDGLLYVYSKKILTAYDPRSLTTIREVTLPIGDSDYPDSFAVDAKGFIYIQTGLWTSYILKIDPKGNVVNTVRFSNAIFSMRNSSDGYLLINNLFQDNANKSYPFRWETLLLNSDLEIQWRRSIGRSPVAAIVEMECVRSPLTLKVAQNGEPRVANSVQYQDFTVTVRNNDSTVCGEQPVSLDLVSSTHTATLQGTSTSTLKPGEVFTTKLRVEAPASFAGSSRFTIQARGELSAKVNRREGQVVFDAPSRSSDDGVSGTQPKPNTSLVAPSAPQRITATRKGARFRFSWSPSSKGTTVKRYLVYLDGAFIKSLPTTTYTVPMNRLGKGPHTFSVRALDESNTMSSERSVKFYNGR